MTTRLAVAALITVTFAGALRAQEDICKPLANSNEAKIFATLSVPIAFTGARAPGKARGVSVGIEVASLPVVDSITSEPTTCRPGKKGENTHPIDGLIRPRIAVAVGGFVFEGAWVPPITMNGVKANLFGVAIARPTQLANGWFLGLRLHAVLGDLHAPVVCNDAALLDDHSECFGGTRSNDRWAPNVFGAEAVVATKPGRLRPHLGVGYTVLRPRFQVDFTNSFAQRDRRKVEVNLQRVSVFGGITYAMSRGALTAEAYSTPADAVAFRLVARGVVLR